MFDLFDDDLDQMELIEGALALNCAVKPSVDEVKVMQQLGALFIEAEMKLAHEPNEKLRFESLLRLFYTEWGFKGDHESYFSSDNVFVDKVLERRQGIPVSLGAVLLYLATKLGLPVTGVTFPTQFILRIDWPGQEPQFLNPFDGELVSRNTLKAWMIGHDGPLAKLTEKDVKASDNPTVVGRWLAVMKSALLREERFTLALRCTDIALSFVPEDPYEIRDRGFIYQQLECHSVAAEDYRFFIEQCPDDPAAEVLKLQVKVFDESPTVLH